MIRKRRSPSGSRIARGGTCLMWLALIVAPAGCNGSRDKSWFGKNRNAAEERWNQVRSEVRLGMAEEAFKGGRYEDAAAQLASVEAQTPGQAGLNLLKAKVAMARGDFVAAEPMLRNIVDCDPRCGEAHYQLGTILQQGGRLDEAIEHYRTAAVQEPMNHEYTLAVAECCLSAGDTEAALAWLQERRHAPGDPSTSARYHLLLAETWRLLGHPGKAASAYSQAILMGADDPQTIAEASDVHMELGDYRQALEYLEPLMSRQADPPPSLVLASARCLLETGRHQEARTRLAVLVRDYEEPGAWLMLGQASARCGDVRAAINNIKHAVELDENNPAPRQVLAGLAMQHGDLSLALSAAENAVQLSPTDTLNYCLLAEVCRRSGNRERAVRLYEHALVLDPDCSVARTELLSLNPELTANLP